MQFIIAILILCMIIVFHELGHFFAAKAFGVGVIEFSIGMGPMLVHRRIGETVYSVRAIPLGGFCAMYGEQSMEADNAKGVDFKSDWEPSRSFDACSGWQRMLIALAGPFFNFGMAFGALLLITLVAGPKFGPVEVVDLGPVPVAEQAGVEIGDILLYVDGRRIETSQSYSAYIDTHPATFSAGYTLTVYRPSEDTVHEIFLMPDEEYRLVGVTYQSQDQTGPFPRLDASWRLLKTNVMMSLDSIAMLLRGDAGLGDLSSMIGITASVGDMIGEAADAQAEMAEASDGTAVIRAIMTVVALISVSLGIMNLLPLPALDGGRVLITLGEMATRKRVPRRVENLVNGLCMIALLILMGAVMVKDAIALFQSM